MAEQCSWGFVMATLLSSINSSRYRLYVRICNPTTQSCSQAEPDGPIHSPSWSLLHFWMAFAPLLDLSPCHSFHMLHLHSLVDLSLFTHSPDLSLCMLNLPGLPSDPHFICYLPCSTVRTCYFSTLYFDQFYTLSLDISPFTLPTFLLWPYNLTIHEQNGFIVRKC